LIGINQAGAGDGRRAMKKPKSGTTVRGIDLAGMTRNSERAAGLLKVMGNAQRLRVLCSLVAGEMTVGEINAEVPLSQSALSQHLAVLRREGLVRTRREAQTIHYALASGPAETVIRTLHGIYCGPMTTRKRKSRM
jgi:DNA-binding transcriptional ArsR family regulator